MTNRQWTDEDAFAAVREACRYLGYDPADNEPDSSVDERLNGTGSDRHFALRDVGLRILTLEAELAAVRPVVEAAEQQVARLREALVGACDAMQHPYCKDTPEGHIAWEAIQKARFYAARTLAATAPQQDGA